jgi:hypothetical protein
VGGILAFLAVALAVAAVIVALSSTGGGSGPRAVDSGDVQQQVDDLKQFLRDNTR